MARFLSACRQLIFVFAALTSIAYGQSDPKTCYEFLKNDKICKKFDSDKIDIRSPGSSDLLLNTRMLLVTSGREAAAKLCKQNLPLDRIENADRLFSDLKASLNKEVSTWQFDAAKKGSLTAFVQSAPLGRYGCDGEWAYAVGGDADPESGLVMASRLLLMSSEFEVSQILAHELAHLVSPCNLIKQGRMSLDEAKKIFARFFKEQSPQAGSIKDICRRKSDETFADRLGARIRENARPYKTQSEIESGLNSLISRACFPTVIDNPIYYQNGRLRLKTQLSSSSLAKVLSCTPEPEGASAVIQTPVNAPPPAFKRVAP